MTTQRTDLDVAIAEAFREIEEDGASLLTRAAAGQVVSWHYDTIARLKEQHTWEHIATVLDQATRSKLKKGSITRKTLELAFKREKVRRENQARQKQELSKDRRLHCEIAGSQPDFVIRVPGEVEADGVTIEIAIEAKVRTLGDAPIAPEIASSTLSQLAKALEAVGTVSIKTPS